MTSTFCRRKISASNSSHHSSGKLENKPGGVVRNTWSRFPVSETPLFAEQMKLIFALSHFASTAVFLIDSRTWIPLRNRPLMDFKNCDSACEFYMLLS